MVVFDLKICLHLTLVYTNNKKVWHAHHLAFVIGSPFGRRVSVSPPEKICYQAEAKFAEVQWATHVISGPADFNLIRVTLSPGEILQQPDKDEILSYICSLSPFSSSRCIGVRILCLCFDNCNSAEDHHGCLVKEKRQVYTGEHGLWLESIPSSNVEDCSEACAERSDCDTFFVDYLKTCHLYRGGTIYVHRSSTAGFCPKGIVSMAAKTYSYQLIFKGKERYNNNGVEVKPAYSPLKCSKDDNRKVCQFPFVLNNEVKWDCVDSRVEDGWTRQTKVCNVRLSGTIQQFQDLNGFKECGECSAYVQSGSVHFKGFGLANHGGKNSYARVDSKEDCQALCDLAEGCNFFNFEQNQRKCHLKYGVGEKAPGFGTQFGSKTPQGC